jgi:hypothetical protein
MDTLISESPATRPASTIGRFLAVVGSCCLFAPLAGFYMTVAAMTRNFTGMTQSNAATDVGPYYRAMGDAFMATLMGYGVSVAGTGLVCLAIFAFSFRPRWLHSALMAGSWFWLIAFPFGTIVAVIARGILVRQRHIFAAG